MAAQQIVKKMSGVDVTFGPGLEINSVVIPPTKLADWNAYLEKSYNESQYVSFTSANMVKLFWYTATSSASLSFRDATKCQEIVRYFNDGKAEACGKYVTAQVLPGQRGPYVQLSMLPLKLTKLDITRGLPALLHPSHISITPNAKLEPASQLQAINNLVSSYGPIAWNGEIRDNEALNEVHFQFLNESDARRAVEKLNNTIQRAAGIKQLYAIVILSLDYVIPAQWAKALEDGEILPRGQAIYTANKEKACLRFESVDKNSILSNRKDMDEILGHFMEPYGDNSKSLDFADPWRKDCSDQECAICFCPPEHPIQTSCGHVYCTTCYEHTVSSNAKDASQNGIKCFGNNGQCGKPLTIRELVSNLGTLGVDQLIDNTLSSYLQANSATYHCCPTPHCERIYEVTPAAADNKGTIQRCMGCFEILCTSCHVQHNHKVTCDKAEDHANGEVLKSLGIKPCPRCKIPIDRYIGCNHVACTCGAHVCWYCMEVFDNDADCYAHMAAAHRNYYAGQPQYADLDGLVDEH
ncbi:hypothetical protein SGCOL_005989 [Colletotrichum sp. CLE4]